VNDTGVYLLRQEQILEPYFESANVIPSVPSPRGGGFGGLIPPKQSSKTPQIEM